MQHLRIINEVLYKIESTEKILLKLKNKSYPSISPQIFLVCLNQVTSIIREQIESLKTSYLENPDSVSIEELATHLYFVRSLTWPLKWIENAGTESVAWSLINPMEKTIQSLDGGIKLIMASHYDEYNYFSINILGYYRTVLEEGGIIDGEEFDRRINNAYQTLPQKIKGQIVGQGAADDEDIPPLAKLGFILFPQIERNSIFQHVLIGHEIAHSFFDENSSSLLDLTSDINYIIKEIDNYIGAQGNESDVENAGEVETTIFSMFYDYFRKGIMEIFCDLFALKLFGFGMIMASYDYCLASQSLNEFQGLHPPWRYRLRVLLKYLDINKFRDSFSTNAISMDHFHVKHQEFLHVVLKKLNDRLSEMENITTNNEDVVLINSNIASKMAYSIIDRRLDDIMQSVDNHMLNCCFTSDLYDDTELILKLCCRIYEDIVPNEVESRLESDWTGGESIDFRHIILAGWIYKIGSIDLIDSTKDYISELSKKNRLILKAIELNDIKREWVKKKRDNVGGRAQ